MTSIQPWTISDLLKATGGKLLCGDKPQVFERIRIDSRRIYSGDLFVAIKGESHDGHKFIGDVIQKGVSGVVLADDKTTNISCSDLNKKRVMVITVPDTTQALGNLAAFWRRQFGIKVVAITGSNGKTSTREMTAMVARQKYKTLTPQGNFNNEIGLSLTLLRLEHEHEWAVLELGMNHPGEISRLASICKPDIGVITNIGPAHLEGVGSIEGVMHAKGELLDYIKPQGCAIFNNDDPLVRMLANQHKGKRILFGRSNDASVRAIIQKGKSGRTSFILEFSKERIPVELKTPGSFMVTNALAAAAVGCFMDLSLSQIKRGLETFEPVSGRLNLSVIGKDIHLIDDTYNANPGSMIAAINTLMALKGDGKGILVIGDMFELGEHAEQLHQGVGNYIGQSDIQLLYITGEFSEIMAESAQAAGMNAGSIFTGSHEEIVQNLISRLRPGHYVLVKGSRGMAMEKVINGLKDLSIEKSDNTV